MSYREEWQLAESFLRNAVQRLSAIPRDEIALWPEWPAIPSLDLKVPATYSEFKFTPMKDTLPDGTIRVAIQMYRHRFMGIGSMTADGFFVEPNGVIRAFTEKDSWSVT